MKRGLIRSAAFFTAIGAATGTALVTAEFARRRDEMHRSRFESALARLGTNEDHERNNLVVSVATGAALGLLTFRALEVIGDRATEE